MGDADDGVRHDASFHEKAVGDFHAVQVVVHRLDPLQAVFALHVVDGLFAAARQKL